MADKKTEEIICVYVCNGKAHDNTIFKTTLNLHPSILALLDSGYRGAKKKHANSQYPLKHKEDVKNLTEEQRKEQKKKNKEISSRRMKIEHIIGRIKRFKILSERYRNHRKRFGLRLNLICGIVNLEKSRLLEVS